METIKASDVQETFSIPDNGEFFVSIPNIDSDGLTSYKDAKITASNLLNNVSLQNLINIIDPNSDIKIIGNQNSYYVTVGNSLNNYQNQIQNLEKKILELTEILLKNNIS